MNSGVTTETQNATEAWAIRSLARVAEALTEALGGQWAEWGEGDLADGVRILARQRDEARAARGPLRPQP